MARTIEDFDEHFGELKTFQWRSQAGCACGLLQVRKELVWCLGSFAMSGQGGVFVQRLASDVAVPSDVQWISRDDRSATAYLQHCIVQSELKQVPFARRRGCGNNIGLICNAEQAIARSWSVAGVPHPWDARLCRNGSKNETGN